MVHTCILIVSDIVVVEVAHPLSSHRRDNCSNKRLQRSGKASFQFMYLNNSEGLRGKLFKYINKYLGKRCCFGRDRYLFTAQGCIVAEKGFLQVQILHHSVDADSSSTAQCL